MKSYYNEDVFHITGPLFVWDGGGVGRGYGVVVGGVGGPPHYWPFWVRSRGGGGRGWVGVVVGGWALDPPVPFINLRRHDFVVTSLQCTKEDAFENSEKMGHLFSWPVSLSGILITLYFNLFLTISINANKNS